MGSASWMQHKEIHKLESNRDSYNTSVIEMFEKCPCVSRQVDTDNPKFKEKINTKTVFVF